MLGSPLLVAVDVKNINRFFISMFLHLSEGNYILRKEVIQLAQTREKRLEWRQFLQEESESVILREYFFGTRDRFAENAQKYEDDLLALYPPHL